MTTYTITENKTFGSYEVAFDSKPQIAVIAAMKALKMRWNPKRSIWYGFQDEKTIIDAIMSAQPESVPTQIATDGYLGATAVAGVKSNRYLSGADLSAAIRADVKAAGIKGVSIRCKTYTGGQHITATFKASADELISEAEYVANYRPTFEQTWIYLDTSDYVHVEDYFKTWNEQACSHDETDIPEIQQRAGRYAYRTATKAGSHGINHYHVDKYTEYTPAFLAKINAVNEIIKNYNYDDSNSMVDYFDTNFYYDLSVDIKEA